MMTNDGILKFYTAKQFMKNVFLPFIEKTKSTKTIQKTYKKTTIKAVHFRNIQS